MILKVFNICVQFKKFKHSLSNLQFTTPICLFRKKYNFCPGLRNLHLKKKRI